MAWRNLIRHAKGMDENGPTTLNFFAVDNTRSNDDETVGHIMEACTHDSPTIPACLIRHTSMCIIVMSPREHQNRNTFSASVQSDPKQSLFFAPVGGWTLYSTSFLFPSSQKPENV